MNFLLRVGSLACTSIALLSSLVDAAPIVTAEFAPPLGLSGGFNVGAGMGIDPPAPAPFDNRLAQTFLATVTGQPSTVSLIVARPASTDAPLWVDIVTMSGGHVASILASGSAPPSTFPTGFDVDPFQFNGTILLISTGTLVAGQEYAMVLRSATPDANYRVFGTDEVRYEQGNALRSQNSPAFQPMLFGADLFFQVTVNPVPEPAGNVLTAFVMAAAGWTRRKR
jgi:hypothetical protein